jgi:RimJ/RimL family protein N-acetyltransferase
MRPLRTQRLILRNWIDADRDLFHRINSEDRVMEFFPFRRDRAQSDALLDRLRGDIEENGFGFAAIEIAETGECAGFAGLSRPGGEPFASVGRIEIGWRLAPEFWGRGYATEAARAWLAHGFDALGLEEIVSFAVWSNERSTAVMKRLGMRQDPSSDFDATDFADSHPYLCRHVVYRLGSEEWAKAGRAAR